MFHLRKSFNLINQFSAIRRITTTPEISRELTKNISQELSRITGTSLLPEAFESKSMSEAIIKFSTEKTKQFIITESSSTIRSGIAVLGWFICISLAIDSYPKVISFHNNEIIRLKNNNISRWD